MAGFLGLLLRFLRFFFAGTPSSLVSLTLVLGASDGFLSDFDFGLGLRFDLSESTDIKIQVDRIQSHQKLLIRNALPSWNGRGTLFSLALNFVF